MTSRAHIRLHPELTTGRPFRNDGLLHAVIALLLRVWPRRNHSSAELAAIEQIKLNRLNKTILQLNRMDAIARDVVLVAEAANLPLPHTFTMQDGREFAGVHNFALITLHAIDVEGRIALVSAPGERPGGKWIHTDDLARAIHACHYKPGDITFAMVEQIQRGKQ